MLSGIIFGSIWLAIWLVLLLGVIQSGEVPTTFYLLFSPFVLAGLAILAGSLFYVLYVSLVYKHIWYVTTNKRAIFQRGLIGRDFDFADYDKIESGTVEVGVIDKLFGKDSGSIAVYANRLVAVTSTDSHGNAGSGARNVPFVFSYITDPYNTFELFKKISFDVKSDIHYPNVLRPDQNKGYKTKYNSDTTKSNS